MTEFDNHYNDETLVSVDCNALQLGNIGLELIIKEDSGFASQTARVVKSVFGWMYQWLGPVGEIMEAVSNGDGKYLFVFQVS